MTEKHWTEDNTLKSTFHRAAYMIFAKKGLLSFNNPAAQKPWQDETYKQVLTDWRAEYNEQGYQTLAEAVAAVKEWADEIGGKLSHASDVITVRVGITRHYQDMSLEYALEASYHMEHMGTITQACNELREMIDTQQEMAAVNRPALMPHQQTTYQTLTADILCTKIRHEFKEGKDIVSLLGGEFQKHGIPVYAEFMDRLQIKVEDLPMGDSEYNRVVRVQLDTSGKPKRAVELVG
jgi:hypothetical protein